MCSFLIITDEDLKFSCTKCDYKFVSKGLVESHIRQHNYEDLAELRSTCYDKETTQFKCCLCQKTNIKTFSLMVSHAMIYHKEEIDLMKKPLNEDDLKFECPECSGKACTKNSILVHRLLEHYNNDVLTCNLCEKNFKNRSGAFSHRVKIHNHELELLNATFTDDDKNHPCQFCGKKYFTNSSLTLHVSRAHGNWRNGESKNMNIQKVNRVKILCLKQ